VGEEQNSFATAFEKAKKFRTDRLDESSKQVQRMRKALNKLKDRGCALCFCMGNDKGRRGHTIHQCPSFRHVGMTWGEYKDWKMSIKYKHHDTICWKCHVPTCSDEMHLPLVKGVMNCEWPDTVTPLALGIFQQNDLREAAERYFGKTWLHLEAFTMWLEKRPQVGHHSNIMDLLLWYVEVWMGQEQ